VTQSASLAEVPREIPREIVVVFVVVGDYLKTMREETRAM
jgi:hypothetical protein